MKRLLEWWRTFIDGPPCPKHPGHRTREMDLELETGCAMMPSTRCTCWAEYQEKYNL